MMLDMITSKCKATPEMIALAISVTRKDTHVKYLDYGAQRQLYGMLPPPSRQARRFMQEWIEDIEARRIEQVLKYRNGTAAERAAFVFTSPTTTTDRSKKRKQG